MITLASDFGSPYPAAMRGVVLQRTDARLVDVAHDFPRQDVRAAAFWLRETLPYFPPAVHLAVVDPGVGTDRDVLVVRAGDHALVGPDNGLLLPPARHVADDLDVFVADPGAPASSTFHGRDVFAPLAADVHEVGVDALGSTDRLAPTDEFVDLELPTASVSDSRAEGDVLVVDDFGNVVTNVPGDFLDGRETVRVNGDAVPVGETFAAVAPGDPVATVGSHGYVECDVNRGRGDDYFGLAPGDEVTLD
ncbi:SAM hydrolase/SAM-dependent halogenase family protein [Salinirarus marinus]|uniref:SAM hydrolase/SAM-dependent halogenase family protein n=1 Tax=Salinirarus marinus TaxID=3068310 RepID=UPI003C6C3F66